MLYRFEDLRKSYGPHDVLKGASWQHNPGERVGLVGRNGAGKTTLFRILLGQEDPEGGEVYRASGLRIGHLSQHLEAERGATLFDFVLSAFADVLAIETKMRDLEHRLADPSESDHDALLEKYALLQHDYEHADGYTIHSEVERVLTGVGFAKDEWDRSILEFSGGQQNRAMLARLLLARVDVLLLDEPTNHLDLRGIEFLEEFLASYQGAYLVISHDRTFLNRTVEKIVELAHGELFEYHGNYDRFVRQRAERMEQMRVEWERQQEMIGRTEEFIRRNIAGQKTKQAQSRRKMLARVEVVDRPQSDETFARFRLDAGPRSTAIAMVAERLRVGYDGKTVVDGVGLMIRRGERYAIMGPNGSGKSTLLKTIAGRMMPLGGELRYGHGIQIGYYDQTLGDLRSDARVLDEIWDLDHSRTEEQVRSYLARFSFFDDEVEKKVSALSGGEKGRLALARIIYVGGNFLLLDEPTNHLDVYTREALEEALEGFTGALVVVSHDRYFIDRLAEHVLLVEDGEAELHVGNYSQVVERLRQQGAAASASRSEPPPRTPAAAEKDLSRRRGRETRRAAERLAEIQVRIGAAEKEIEGNHLALCAEEVWKDGERVRVLQERSAALKAEIDALYSEWDALEKG
ncbi:MAG TPA: ABC-F family ATP-binding cassette domain-containing protein [Thermoanaerobaculia bacterium]|nr:ABC-F family ATP-binding cassette domain-containing protein [Thermoanaerobaculia bacterium]